MHVIMEIISGERLQKIADIAIIDNGNPNNKYYSKEHFMINENINSKISLFINANIIYVKTDYLHFFANNILPRLTHKFILITHNSDYTVGANHITVIPQFIWANRKASKIYILF